MNTVAQRNLTSGTITALALGLTLIACSPAWAGPYLLRSAESSIAGSTRECGQLSAKALSRLAENGALKVDSEKNKYLGWTKDSTVYVDCIFVGKNEARRDQWIYYVSIASSDERESKSLHEQMRREIGRTVRIDE
jgi:hypothetical protein